MVNHPIKHKDNLLNNEMGRPTVANKLFLNPTSQELFRINLTLSTPLGFSQLLTVEIIPTQEDQSSSINIWHVSIKNYHFDNIYLEYQKRE